MELQKIEDQISKYQEQLQKNISSAEQLESQIHMIRGAIQALQTIILEESNRIEDKANDPDADN